MTVKEVRAVAKGNIRIEMHDDKDRMIAWDVEQNIDDFEVKQIDSYSDGGCRWLRIII